MSSEHGKVRTSIESGKDVSNDESKSMITNEQEASKSIQNGRDASVDETLDPLRGPQEEDQVRYFFDKKRDSYSNA